MPGGSGNWRSVNSRALPLARRSHAAAEGFYSESFKRASAIASSFADPDYHAYAEATLRLNASSIYARVLGDEVALKSMGLNYADDCGDGSGDYEKAQAKTAKPQQYLEVTRKYAIKISLGEVPSVEINCGAFKVVLETSTPFGAFIEGEIVRSGRLTFYGGSKMSVPTSTSRRRRESRRGTSRRATRP